MDLKEVMANRSFAVLGDTLNGEKYAHRIKEGLKEKGYNVYAVGEELSSLNEIGDEIDIVDLCINPVKGLKLLQECEKTYKCIVIQPGASNDEMISYLQENRIPYLDACLLVGLNLYT